MSKEKERLDTLLVDKGFFTTREKAKKSIMAGVVFVDNKRVDKAGEMVHIDSKIDIKGNPIPYVSRGGLKLEKALKVFDIETAGKTAVDIGASTGGFTDCLLKNGASNVISIDVGYGQFAWELRTDPRVTLMERTNIRYITIDDIGKPCDIAAIDVSFISLRLVLPVVKSIIKPGGDIICLIKPQFEAGRDKIGKNGVVKDPVVHKEVIKNIVDFAFQIGLNPVDLCYSPIKGPEGNIEYLLYAKNIQVEDYHMHIYEIMPHIVEESHKIDI